MSLFVLVKPCSKPSSKKTSPKRLIQNQQQEKPAEKKPVKGLDTLGSMDLRVPFGLDQQTGELVDVADVPRGLACGCICPSCKVPLQAKQGEINRWYFAHETRGTYKLAADQCELSIWTAMVLMARQEISRALTFKTPFYELKQAGLTQLVTESRDLPMEQCEIEHTHSGVRWDALLSYKGFMLALVMTHPEKGFSMLMVQGEDAAKLGVINVDLQLLWNETIRKVGRGDQTRRNAFRQELLEGVAGKRWEFHPRETRAREELARRIAAQPVRSVREPPSSRTPRTYSAPSQQRSDESGQRTTVRCLLCRAVWVHIKYGEEPCPGCGAHAMWIPEP